MAKYRKGELVASIGDAANTIIDGKPLYFHEKCQNSSWLRNMTLHTLNLYVAARHVWYAIENPAPLDRSSFPNLRHSIEDKSDD